MKHEIKRSLLIFFIGILSLLGISGNAAAQSESLFILPIILITIIIVVIVVWIIVIIWVYRDAQSRGMNAVLWLIVVLVGGIVGIIIYLIIRRDHPVGSYPHYRDFTYPRYYYHQYYYPPPYYPPPQYYYYPPQTGQYPPGQYSQEQYPHRPQPQVGKPLSKARPLKKSVAQAGTKRKETPSKSKLKKVP